MEPDETPKGVALLALKEIEFDRETGKLSDADYQYLKDKYTAEALEALREEGTGAPGMPGDVEALIAHRVQDPSLRCGLGAAGRPDMPLLRCPRPEPDALYCSTCGSRLARAGGMRPVRYGALRRQPVLRRMRGRVAA